MLSFTLRNVLLGAILLGLTGGVLGSFTLLRRQSLLGDALAHAALPGVVLAFMLTGVKSQPVLLVGALVAGVAGALLIQAITRHTRLKADSAFGIVLSVFFGGGIVLLTQVQRMPGGNQSGLDHFLFGQASAIMPQDLLFMGAMALAALLLVALFFKEFKLLAFDREFGASQGFRMGRIEVLLTSLLVLAILLGLQTVGVVLMVATLVTPAAAARQWTDRLGAMVLLSGGIGALSGATGVLLSGSAERLPTGPSIVLALSAALVISLLFAPRRGLLGSALRRRAGNRRIRRENLLKDMYKLIEAGAEPADGFTMEALRAPRGRSAAQIAPVLRSLLRSGELTREGDRYLPSPSGLAEATEMIRKHRLWELYLTRFLDLPGDHVHRDAEAMEHALDEAAVDRLEELLGFPTVDPHGEPIPARRRA